MLPVVDREQSLSAVKRNYQARKRSRNQDCLVSFTVTEKVGSLPLACHKDPLQRAKSGHC